MRFRNTRTLKQLGRECCHANSLKATDPPPIETGLWTCIIPVVDCLNFLKQSKQIYSFFNLKRWKSSFLATFGSSGNVHGCQNVKSVNSDGMSYG
jgi:hypothetical protein